jgi:signal transduction histidine kinase/ActR/RegA family two-component response regulator
MTVHDIDPNFPAAVWSDHWKQLKQEGSMIIESRHRTKDDRIFPVEISVNYLEFEDKEYNCAFARDISDRKQAEEERERMQVQLREAQKMEAIGTLAGGIAHDFNNLLQAVQGYAELLLLDRESEEPEHQHLQRIVNAAKRGSALTQQLLTFSRKVESKLKPIDLNRKIFGIKDILLRTIPKMIEINLQLGGDVQAILADPVQIEQILMNLAVNAKDAMTEGGELVIETKNVVLDNEFCLTHSGATPGDYVLLTISDTGQGMDEQTLDHIFEPFFTTKGVGKGTGLGLATVYGIVKSHLGYISCDSKVGEGTTFNIYFPAIAQEEVLMEQAETGMVLAGGDETILLVDDEDYNRDFGKEILARAGYRVLTAVDGESALEVYLRDYQQLELYHKDQERIALVILDLIMPGIGGRKCLVELLSINSKVKVLIASGYSEVGSMKNPLEYGAKGFIGKPYEIKKMLKVVREVLDGK